MHIKTRSQFSPVLHSSLCTTQQDLNQTVGEKPISLAPPIRMIWKLQKVKEVTGYQKSALYLAMALPSNHPDKLPSSVRLGGRAVGWYSDEILAWVNSRSRTRTNEKVQTFGQQTLEAQV